MENEYSPGQVQVEETYSLKNCYIKLSGLPWKATEDEIVEFLAGCEIVGNIVIIKNEAGRPSGDAVVKLVSQVDLAIAMKRNRENLHDRFIIVEETDSEAFDIHNNKVRKLETEENTFIHLRGLIWSVTEEDIKKFLHDSKIKKVVIKKNSSGRPTGDAFVELESEVDVQKAKSHNKEYLGERFVIVEEIYESQFIKETKEAKETRKKDPAPSKMKDEDYSNTHLKLSNLPLETSELEIQTFLADVTLKQVTVLPNSSGSPNGQAIIELETKDDYVRSLICHNSSMRSKIIRVDKVGKSEVLKGFTEKELESGKGEASKGEKNYHIKLSGLPWKATKDEIRSFLVDTQIVGEVVIIINHAGKPSGDALVKLRTKEDLVKALECNRNYLHNRFVVVEETDEATFKRNDETGKDVKKENKKEKLDVDKPSAIRLKGLVWSATEKDIKSFLHDCDVTKVEIATNERGKPTGEAIVHLLSKSDVEKAKSHNRQYLGERFVIVESF